MSLCENCTLHEYKPTLGRRKVQKASSIALKSSWDIWPGQMSLWEFGRQNGGTRGFGM